MGRMLFAWGTFLISEIFAALTIIYLYHFDAAAWTAADIKKSSWHTHVLIMGGCMIVLNGHGMVFFRLLPRVRTVILKYIHALIHMGILGGAIYAVIVAHNFMEEHDHPLFLHAYVGMFTMILYIIQFILAVLIYLYLYSDQRRRKLFASYHNFLGVVILQFAITSSCIQLQNLTYEINYDDNYAFYAMVSMVIYGLLVNCIVLNPYLEWRLVGPI